MQLERSGVSVVIICTDEFTYMAKAQAEASGLPDLRILEIPHPITGVPETLVRQRAKEAFPLLTDLIG